MTVLYSYAEAAKDLSSLLKKAIQEGEIRLANPDGQVFILRPEQPSLSPLAVEGVDLGLTAVEIVEFIHDGRRG